MERAADHGQRRAAGRGRGAGQDRPLPPVRSLVRPGARAPRVRDPLLRAGPRDGPVECRRHGLHGRPLRDHPAVGCDGPDPRADRDRLEGSVHPGRHLRPHGQALGFAPGYPGAVEGLLPEGPRHLAATPRGDRGARRHLPRGGVLEEPHRHPPAEGGGRREGPGQDRGADSARRGLRAPDVAAGRGHRDLREGPRDRRDGDAGSQGPGASLRADRALAGALPDPRDPVRGRADREGAHHHLDAARRDARGGVPQAGGGGAAARAGARDRPDPRQRPHQLGPHVSPDAEVGRAHRHLRAPRFGHAGPWGAHPDLQGPR